MTSSLFSIDHGVRASRVSSASPSTKISQASLGNSHSLPLMEPPTLRAAPEASSTSFSVSARSGLPIRVTARSISLHLLRRLLLPLLRPRRHHRRGLQRLHPHLRLHQTPRRNPFLPRHRWRQKP